MTCFFALLIPFGAFQMLLWSERELVVGERCLWKGTSILSGGCGPGNGRVAPTESALCCEPWKCSSVSDTAVSWSARPSQRGNHLMCPSKKTNRLDFQNSTEGIESSFLVSSPFCLFKITNSLGSHFQSSNE